MGKSDMEVIEDGERRGKWGVKIGVDGASDLGGALTANFSDGQIEAGFVQVKKKDEAASWSWSTIRTRMK